MMAWLGDPDSLTARLRCKSGNRFSVQILKQAWALPHVTERRLLGMANREWALVREVLLCGAGEPWVFARSVMPARSLQGDLTRLRKLDRQPLGHLLFNYPLMQRSSYQFCRMAAGALRPEVVADRGANLWGRRSRFDLAGRSIMVSEIFLPTFQP